MNSGSAVVGNDAGWHLLFFTDSEDDPLLSIGIQDYYAAIDATLPSNLEGGTYNVAIEGITNAHYQALHDTYSGGDPLYVDLYLYWRDTSGVVGYLANVAGVTGMLSGTPDDSARVARLRVTKLSRRVGARRYEAVIEATERVYAALTESIGKMAVSPDARQAAVAICDALLADLPGDADSYVDEGQPTPPSGASWPPTRASTWKTGVDALADLGRSMEELSGKGGRGMYLIQDGQVHIGVRAMPAAVAITDALGLAHAETSTSAAVAQGDDATPRVQYNLICKGRPDIAPGDKLTFTDPFTGDDGGAADPDTTTPASFAQALQGLATSTFGGAQVAGATVELYVTSVNHKLSRTDGFVTMVTGLAAAAGDEWDQVEPGRASPPPPSASTHGDIARAIGQLAGDDSEPLVVGEVRAATVSGDDEPPSQTVDVWLGTVASDGGPARARRLDIDRDSPTRVPGVPYLTPFAWGKTGLVLPRYPGTRVVVAHAGGRADDPVELGAVWQSGHGPDAQPGDWWLILPAAVPANARQSVEDATTPDEPSQHATNDLIDADGARTIEVGRITIRVQPTKLAAPGTRPPAPSDSTEQVTIEHENGSRIVIKDSGDIVIHAEGNMTLSATKALTLQGDSVAVKVTNTMDVSDP